MKKIIVGTIRNYRDNRFYIYDIARGASVHNMTMTELADELDCELDDMYKIYYYPKSNIIACETQYNTFIVKEPGQAPYEVNDSEFVFIRLLEDGMHYNI